MTEKIHQEIKAKMSQRERRLERELNATGVLCAAQMTKNQRLRAEIGRLEKRIEKLEARPCDRDEEQHRSQQKC